MLCSVFKISANYCSLTGQYYSRRRYHLSVTFHHSLGSDTVRLNRLTSQPRDISNIFSALGLSMFLFSAHSLTSEFYTGSVIVTHGTLFSCQLSHSWRLSHLVSPSPFTTTSSCSRLCKPSACTYSSICLTYDLFPRLITVGVFLGLTLFTFQSKVSSRSTFVQTSSSTTTTFTLV